MVAQRNKGIRMRSRATRGKENILSSLRLRRKEETYLRKLELGISVFRNKIQTRVDRCQEVLQRLDHDSKQMQICFLQLLEMVENSRKLISDEKEENLQLLQLLDCYSDQTHVSSKTQTVSPMVYGIPLKKASISLKRLDPFREQHNYNTSRDSSPASAVGFSRTVAHTPLGQSIEALEITSSSSSLSDEEDSNITLARHRPSKKWNEVTHHVSSTSGREIHLKRASIQLKRLDPQSYLPHAGHTESLSSNNMSFRRSDIESDVFDSLYRTAIEANAENMNTRTEPACVSSGLSYIPCHNTRPDPIVVLKRLGPFPRSGESDCHDQNMCSHSASCDHENENYQLKNKLKVISVTSEKLKTKPENMKNSQQPVDSMSTSKKRKSENIVSVVSEKRKANCRINAGKRPVKENADRNTDIQRRKTETNRKRKEKETTVAVSATNKMDEDPLEGPSWLYKDGVKKEKFKKMRRIRQGYLTPLYYLAPTIYSSTDDSGDEMTANERKNSKLRKKKQRKRN